MAGRRRRAVGDQYPGDPEEYEDPDNAPPPGLDDAKLEALLAGAREITAGQARTADICPTRIAA